MRWVICPSCGTSLPEEAADCAGCGADVTDDLLVLEDAPAAGGRGRGGPSPLGRRLTAVSAAGALLFLVVGALSGPPEETSGGGHPARPAIRTDPPAVLPTGWTWKPTGPLAGRHGHVAVWTGAEVVLWGGERPGRAPQGAAYDPATDAWRRVAQAPLENRSGAAAGWTGREVLVWGGINGRGQLGDGAAYHPGTDRWRLLPVSPLSGRVPLVSAWTGREFVVVGARGYGRTAGATEAAAYDPTADTWRMLPPVPVTINEGTGVWTGRELVVYGGLLDRARRPLTPGDRAVGAAFDPVTGSWRTLPEAPLSSQALAVVWNGERVVAWDWELAAAALDPALDQWTDLPPLPIKRRDCLPAGVGAGSAVFAQHCGQGAILERGRRHWRVIDAPRGAWGAPLYTGESLVLWLGPSGRPHDGTWLHRLA